MDIIFLIVLILIGIAIGFLGAMLGIGGGIILIPVLTVVFNIDIHSAIAASIVIVVATSTASATHSLGDKLTNIRLSMVLEIATTSGAIAGAITTSHLKISSLAIIFAAMSIYSAYSMVEKINPEKTKQYGNLVLACSFFLLAVVSSSLYLIPPTVFLLCATGFFAYLHATRLTRLPKPERPKELETKVETIKSKLADRLKLHGKFFDTATGKERYYKVKNVPRGLALSFLAGNISGLLGIGGGVIKVPAMANEMGVPMKVATATSNFTIGVTAVASAYIYYANGYLMPMLIAPLVLGVVPGSVAGFRFAYRAQGSTIRLIFASLLVFVAFLMLSKVL
ncbi:MAG: sulfite exporter TauE/SafE family protein [Thermoplasmata archaeon]